MGFLPLPAALFHPDKKCQVEDCQRKRLAKGLCSTHYDRQRQFGPKRPEILARKKASNNKYVLNGRKRLYGIRERYGVTIEEAAKLAATTHCDACGKPFRPRDAPGIGIAGNKFNDSPGIDHDHKTGAIRGVLHQRCNRALGFLREDLDDILGLARYIQRFK